MGRFVLAWATTINVRCMFSMNRERPRSWHKVTSAMVYPSFVIGVGMILVVFFMSFMLPRFMSIFDKIGGTLPTSTRILQMVSEVFSHWLFWLVILGGGALLAAIFAAWRKQP